MTKIRVVAVASVLMALCSLVWPLPAAAQTQPTMNVPVNETVTTKYRALVGPNYQQGRRPVACAASTRLSCDTIPVALGLSPEELAGGEHIVIVRTDWNIRAKQSVPAVAEASDDQVNTFIYTDPPRVVKDVITEETSAFLSPPPTEISVFKPATNKLLITVENMYGVNDGYTLSVGLFDLGGGPGADGSVDDGGSTLDLSDDSNVAVTPSFNEEASSGGGVTIPISAAQIGGSRVTDAFDLSGGDIAEFGRPTVTLDILSLGSDVDLDDLGGVTAQTSFGLGKTEKIAKVTSGPPAPQSASALELVLWFGLLPASLAGGAFLLAARRRRQYT